MTPRIAFELAVFAAVLAIDAAGFVPLALALGLLPATWLLLRLAREPWSSLGLSVPPRRGRAILLGVALGLAMELLAVFVTTPLIGRVPGAKPDHSDLEFVRGSLAGLAVMLVLHWTLAAFGEELCIRGFLLNRLARALGGGRAAWIVALVGSSAPFGWLHLEQNPAGAVQESPSGLLLGALFLATGRNLTVPIVAHGLSNGLAFVLIYLGRYTGQA